VLRDNLRDKKYFDEYIEFNIETIEEYIDDLNHDQSLSIESKMKFSFGIVDYLLSLIHQRYSRGDNLTELKAHLEAALKYRIQQNSYANNLPANEQMNRIGSEELREDYLEKWLCWFAFSYNLDMGQAYHKQVLDLINNHGQDILFDKIAVQLGDRSREVGDSLLYKKRFEKLYKVIESTAENRARLVLNYLNSWYKLIGSPDYHLMDTDAYDGYWCWEAALVVKLYDIDDSSFIDHEYYPKDLVHWQDNSNN